MLSILGQMQDIYIFFFWGWGGVAGCKYNIYRLVQDMFPADIYLQVGRYQEYSNNYFYLVSTY